MTTKLLEALTLAEETLRDIVRVFKFETGTPVEALAVIRAARAQEQDSIELYVKDRPDNWHTIPLYAAPQPVKQEPVGWLDECGVFRSAEDWDLSGVEGAIPLHTGLQTSQKPVGVIKLWESETGFQNADYEFYGLPIGTHKLYAAPVSAEAIRAEALEEVVKFLSESGLITPTGRFAAAIRGLE